MAKLNSEKQKKSLFYKEKSLVGLTPEVDQTQGTQVHTIGSTLFCFPKSKQIISLLEGWIR